MRNNDNLLLQYYMIWDYGCWEEEMEKNGRHRRSRENCRRVIRSINKKQEIGHERKRREEMRWEQRRKARKSDYRETWRKDPILLWYLLYFLLHWCTLLCSALLSSVLQLYRLIAYNGFTTVGHRGLKSAVCVLFIWYLFDLERTLSFIRNMKGERYSPVWIRFCILIARGFLWKYSISS